MSIEKSDIEKLSQLARINVSEESMDVVASRLNDVLSMVDQLQAVDTEGVEPMSHPLDALQRLRADEVTERDQRQILMSNAPAQEDGLFLVPKVID